MRTDRTLLASLLFAVWPAIAQTPPATFEVDMLDPWVPPAVRAKAKSTAPVAAPTRGAELDAQVERTLRQRFDSAASPDGTLTREQARIAGLGRIAAEFDAIDRSGRGAIRFEDYRRHLRERARR